MTLLRDPTSSHLLETLVNRASEPVFAALWSIYFVGKLPPLAAHPVANFVVTKALYRTDEKQLQEAYAELQNSWQKIIREYIIMRFFFFLNLTVQYL
jgi:nucleolar protein 9